MMHPEGNYPLCELNGELTADSRWYVQWTGGGCTVLERCDRRGGPFWWITVPEGGKMPETPNEAVCLGLYDAEGDAIGYWYLPNLQAALNIANGMNVA